MTELSVLSKKELAELIEEHSREEIPDLSVWPYSAAKKVRDSVYGNKVFVRGLVEFTSYCGRDCLYCGLRRSNMEAQRYRLRREEILFCCEAGYMLGFRSFVMQGGEDAYFTDRKLCGIVEAVRTRFPECAITLSAGERSAESYRALKSAGADRYLLRHETADPLHYSRLHPPEQTLESRKSCLYALREAGFYVGAGFMVGTPGQMPETLAEDLVFLRELQPHMVGIGPFLPHHATPLAGEAPGGISLTLLMLALTRLTLPTSLLPSTTALASVHPHGRVWGLEVGANVVMPNISPAEVRGAYSIYDGKLVSGSEAAEGLERLVKELKQVGYVAEFTRGDPVKAF